VPQNDGWDSSHTHLDNIQNRSGMSQLFSKKNFKSQALLEIWNFMILWLSAALYIKELLVHFDSGLE